MPLTPYWENEKHGLQIYHGDCNSVLLQLERRFNAFLTDPFYGVDGGRGGQARERGKAKYDGAEKWSDTPEGVSEVAVPAVEWCIAHSERGAVTPGSRCMSLYPDPADIGCFWQPAGIGLGPWGFTTFQPILYYGKDYRAGKGSLPTGRKVTERAEKVEHPCPKPIGAWSWLMGKVSQDGESVVDPFLGSGTTLIVAYRLGRGAIGIDICEEYCELSAKRMEEEIKQGKLFCIEKETKPQQSEILFD